MTFSVISGNDSRRPRLASMLHCKLAGSRPTNTQPRPKSSPVHIFGVDTEVSKHKCLDVAKQEGYLWEYIADQEALLMLEKELQSCTGKWQYWFFFFLLFMLTSNNENKQLFHLPFHM